MTALDSLYEQMGAGATICKRACRVVATSNITLSGLQTINGVALAAGDRVLVTGQTTASKNGVYIASDGTWARAIDMASNRYCHLGMIVPVLEGTLKGLWQLSSPTTGQIYLGVTSLSWVRRLAGVSVVPSSSTPSPVAAAGAAGTSESYSPADHVHAHDDQAGGTLHATASADDEGFMPRAHYSLVAGATDAATAGKLVKRDGSGNAKFVGVDLSNLTSPSYPDSNGDINIIPGLRAAGSNSPGVIKVHGKRLHSDNKGIAVVLMAGNPETSVAEFGQLFGFGGGDTDFGYWRIAWSSIGVRTQMLDGNASKLWMVECLNGADARFDLSNSSGCEWQVYASGGYAIRVSGDGVVRIGVSGSSTVHEIGGSTATTVGAAGAASALPATPTGYLRVVINGTTRKIPYYAD